MIAVIYWSGTGNTAEMAEAVGKGIAEAGQEVVVKSVSDITAEEAATYDKLALGCADMGAEQLEELEFEPFYVALEPSLSGKKLVIFGSWGWGGTWLEDWGNRIKEHGGELLGQCAVMGAPDDAGKQECEELGKTLANA